ncbi:MAG: hypothetical protein WGN25_14500 [Candidatus Electrothrix sp. GW3-4]|uniref:hypothetical protein n=1 Tax=Candidatus Electrothrix sp. GW3-4 TaxID=3126740 RepID=UPI0030D030C3
MNLIFIHGRDQQGKNPQELQTQWEEALERGWSNAGLSRPNNLNVIFPFYGDKLIELMEVLETPLVADVTTRGAAPDTKEASLRGEMLAELAENAGITDEDIKAHYSGQAVEKGPLNWEWIQAILRALDSTPMGEATLDLFTRDVYVYLTNRAIRKAINKIIKDKFNGEPCVVVGHSLGTVVLYNVLRELGSQANAKYCMTLGSPLGIKAIKRLLVPPALAMPTGVLEWFNAYDERDVVALRPLDSEVFPIDPSVRNKSDVDNHTDNRHGIVGYLDDREVAQWIYNALTQ